MKSRKLTVYTHLSARWSRSSGAVAAVRQCAFMCFGGVSWEGGLKEGAGNCFGSII